MADVIESVVRVGIAGWLGESDAGWDTPRVLGVVGELCLVEIDADNRDSVLPELVDGYDLDERKLRVEGVFFGDAGSVFASSLDFLEHWPKSAADLPVEVFVDDHYKGTFTGSADEVIVSVRHVLRPDRPPRRQFRFRPGKYEEAMSDLARESRHLRDQLITVAQEHAPDKLALLRAFLQRWPA